MTKETPQTEQKKETEHQTTDHKKHAPIMIFICVCAVLFLFVLFQLPLGVDMQLNGDARITLEVGTDYTEEGCFVTYRGEDISEQVQIENTVDTDTLGTYTLTYIAQTKGNFPVTLTRTVDVVDETPCEIELKGGDYIIVALENEYTEYGYRATDNYDGDLTANVTVTSNVDCNVIGIYEVSYEVTDSSGNLSKAIRTVKVTDYDPLSASLKDFSLNGFFPEAILQQTNDGGEAYLEDMVIIGDSIAGNFVWIGDYTYDKVWAHKSLTPESMLSSQIDVYGKKSYGTIAQNIAKYKPKRILLFPGVSGISWMSTDYYILKTTQLIDQIKEKSPDTQIMIASILPIDNRYDTDPSGFSNQKINTMNFYLAQMCQGENVKFLNIAEAMKNKKGQAKEGWTFTSDGIHPTSEAYNAIVQYIRTHMYE